MGVSPEKLNIDMFDQGKIDRSDSRRSFALKVEAVVVISD